MILSVKWNAEAKKSISLHTIWCPNNQKRITSKKVLARNSGLSPRRLCLCVCPGPIASEPYFKILFENNKLMVKYYWYCVPSILWTLLTFWPFFNIYRTSNDVGQSNYCSGLLHFNGNYCWKFEELSWWTLSCV